MLCLVGSENIDVERGPFLAEEGGHESGEGLSEACADFVLLILGEVDLRREALQNLCIALVQPHVEGGAQSKKEAADDAGL